MLFPKNETTKTPGMPTTTRTFTGRGRVTYSAGVDIANPNLWLANRMGVINPAVVAWDLVPWSFVVNMFVNVNAVLGSFTDLVGLNLTNVSVTKSYTLLQEEVVYTKWSEHEAYYASSSVVGKGRSRTSGSIPKPSLRLRLPNVNFELMAIASALLRQKVGSMR
jgi:hypothetical protein